MAALAILAKPAIVHIVPGVAAATGGRQCHVLVRGFFMAGQTIDALVPTIQLELGALVVIVVPDFPTTGVVAQTALRTQASLMLIVLQVTRDTSGSR